MAEVGLEKMNIRWKNVLIKDNLDILHLKKFKQPKFRVYPSTSFVQLKNKKCLLKRNMDRFNINTLVKVKKKYLLKKVQYTQYLCYIYNFNT